MVRRKEDDFDLDMNFDIDQDLDLPDFDLDEPIINDDRKPITKLATSFFEGAKTGLKDSNFIRQSIKDILPRGYGQTIDLSDQFTEGMKDIYDRSVKEFAPAAGEFKQAAASILPKESRFIPDALQRVLERWREEAKESSVLSTNQQRSASMNAQLTELFGGIAQQNANIAAEESVGEKIRDGIEFTRHRDMYALADESATALRSLAAYQNKVGIGFQKKSLELQYQSLFALQDTLLFLQSDSRKRDEYLANIVKNTGLPDFVKIGRRENLHQVIRNKFYDRINDGLFGDRNKAIERIVGNVRDTVVSNVAGIASGLSMGVSGAQDIKDKMDIAQDMQGMGMGDMADPKQLAAGIAGGASAKWAASRLGFNLRDRIQGSWIDRKLNIIDRGKDLETAAISVPQRLNEFRLSNKWDFDDSIGGKAMRLAQTFMPNLGPDMDVDQVHVRRLDEPYNFTRRTDRSINEIIPGFLSRILREMQILRTGDTSLDLTEYDQRNFRFTSRTENKLNAFRSIVSPNAVRGTSKRLDELLGELDQNNELSEEGKKALRERLLRNSANLREANASNLASEAKYENVPKEVAEEVAAHMRKYFEQMNKDQQVLLARRHNELINDIAETRGAIQQEVNLGNTDDLIKLGLLDRTGRRISMDGIISQYLNPENMAKEDAPAQSMQSEASRAFNDLMGTIGKKGKSSLNNMQEFMKNGYRSGKQTFNEQSKKLAPWWNTFKGNVAKRSKDTATRLNQFTQAATQSSQETLKKAPDEFTKLWSAAKENPFTQSTQRQYGALKSNLNTFGSNQWDRLKDLLPEDGAEKAKDDLKSMVIQVKDQANQFKINAQSSAQGALNQANQSLKSTVDKDQIADKISHAFKSGMFDLKQNFSQIPQLHLNHLLSTEQAKTETGKDTETPAPDASMKKTMQQQAQQTWSQIHQATQQMLNNAKQKVGDFLSDVYVEGETEPRMRAAKMAQGDYRDRETGEPITKLEDIRGDVVDTDNNIVIKTTEFDRLRTYSQKTKQFSLLRLVPRPIKRLTEMAWHYQTKIAPKWVAWNWKQTKRIGAFAWKATRTLLGLNPEPERDVFVGDEREPRLIAAKIKAGYYRHKDGRPLKHQNDIQGAIVDENDQVMIDESELGNLRVYNSIFKVFNPLKLVGITARAVGRAAKWFQFTTAPWLVKQNIRAVKAAGRFVAKRLGMRIEPEDVYVQGQEKPSLFGKLMREGKYFSRRTGKPIENPGQIDGDIVDESGQVQLSEKEIEAGLSDANGARIGTQFTSLLRRGLSGLNRALSVRVKLPTKSTRQDIADQTRNDLNKVFGRDDKNNTDDNGLTKASVLNKLTPDRQQVMLLKDMLKLQTSQLKKKVFGDSDGDGIRENSFWDKFKKRESKKQEDQQTEKAARAGMGGKGLLAGLAGMFGGNRNKQDNKQEQDDDSLGILEWLGLGSMAKDGLAGLLKGGKWLKGGALKAIPWLLRALPFAGKAGAMGAGGAALAGAGTAAAGGAAAAAGTTAATAALTGAAATGVGAATTAGAAGAAGATLAGTAAAGGGLLSTIGAIGGGLLSFLSSPIVLGAAALALGGYGIYKGYKHLTRGRMNALEKIRYVQYGFPADKPNEAHKVLALEEFLKPYLKEDNEGVRIEDKDILIEKLMEIFDLSAKDKRHVELFFSWYQRRFKPVYLTHVIAYKGMKGNTNLDAASSLTGEEKKKFIEATRFNNGPYHYKSLPTLDETIKATDIKQVEAVIEETLQVVNATAKDNVDPAKLKKDQTKEKADAAKKPGDGINRDDLRKAVFTDASEKNGDKLKDYGPPDAEEKPDAAGATQKLTASATTLGTAVNMADGPVRDGRYGADFVRTKSGVRLDKLNPQMLKNFYAMAQEYGEITGKTITINDAYRSYEAQVAAKRKYGARAAQPGSSMHEFGLALDAQSSDLDALDKLGLMKKYGFTRPVGQEPWHVEPAGIQANLNKYKHNPELAAQAIEAGLGRGGGGYGTVGQEARKYGRNRDLAVALLQKDPTPNVKNEPSKLSEGTELAQATPQTKDQKVAGAGMQRAVYADANSSAVPKSAGISPAALTQAKDVVQASPDAEPKPGNDTPAKTTVPRETTRAGRSSHAVLSNNSVTGTELSGPAANIPQVKGAGYNNVKDTILAAARVTGVNPDTMIRVAAVESDFNPSARARPQDGSAEGLYGITDGTWVQTTRKYGDRYGITPNTPQSDGRANALMGGHYLKENERILSSVVDGPVGVVENYIAHFLGATGAKRFFKAYKEAPNTPAANLFPTQAKSNTAIFYANGQPRTIAQIYQLMRDKIANKVQAHGVPVGDLKKPLPSTASIESSLDPRSESIVESDSPAAVPQPPRPYPEIPSTDARRIAQGSAYARSAQPDRVDANQSSVPFRPMTPNLTPFGQDSFGINPQLAPQPIRSSRVDLANKDLFDSTNQILRDQLEVQKDLRTMATKIVEMMQKKSDEASAAPAPAPATTPAVTRPRQQTAMKTSPIVTQRGI